MIGELSKKTGQALWLAVAWLHCPGCAQVALEHRGAVWHVIMRPRQTLFADIKRFKIKPGVKSHWRDVPILKLGGFAGQAQEQGVVDTPIGAHPAAGDGIRCGAWNGQVRGVGDDRGKASARAGAGRAHAAQLARLQPRPALGRLVLGLHRAPARIPGHHQIELRVATG